MNEYNDLTLVNDFPYLYANRYEDMYTTAMCWGFECGDGWEPIIRHLSEELEFLNENASCSVRAEQVKEKFGTLRFYVSITDATGKWADIIWDLVDMAELRTSYTCEVCGEHGKRRGNGWIHTLCDLHHEENEGFDHAESTSVPEDTSSGARQAVVPVSG